MSQQATKAIILAAGAGRRLGLAGPKCMAEVGEMSIIHRQLAAFTKVGVGDFVIVVGHEQKLLREHLALSVGNFEFIENPRFAETNTIYSLYLARYHFDAPFFYANADVVFDHRLAERLQHSQAPTALAVQVGQCGPEEVKVIVENDRIIRIGKKLEPSQCLGEFVGVARFGQELLADFAKTLETQVEHDHVVNDYFERAVDDLVDRWPLRPVDVSDLPCREIDFPDDLALAREKLAPQLIRSS